MARPLDPLDPESPDETGSLRSLLEAAGFAVHWYPLTEVGPPGDPRPLARGARTLLEGGTDLVVLTSARAVRALAGALADAGGEGWRRPTGLRVWAVGTSTARACAAAGLAPDRIPSAFSAEGLTREMAGWGPLEGQRVLFPRAAAGRDLVATALAEAGAVVTLVEAYRTEELPDEGARLLADARHGGLAAVALTAGSQARVLGRAAAGTWPNAVPIVVIGPSTEAAARAAGLPVAGGAEPHTFEGLVAALQGVRASASPSGADEGSGDRQVSPDQAEGSSAPGPRG
jgi:uroporphyrinogen-III synthase